MKKIVLFGSGQIGRYMLELFPKEMVLCFADNKNAGGIIDGIPIISYRDFLEIAKYNIIIITTKFQFAEEIAKQFETDQIKDYIYWEELMSDYDSSLNISADCFRYNHPDRANQESKHEIKEVLERILFRNTDSEVEFYFVDYFELSHYLPIYQGLKNKGIKVTMVTEPRIINTKKAFNYNDTVDLLNEKQISYYTLANPNAKVAITTQFAANLDHYNNKKCHLAYGVAFTVGKSFILEPENANSFDIVMVQGSYYKETIKNNGFTGTLVSISYPRYNDFFSSKPTKNEICNKLEIETDKPIITYLPTYDEGTSIKKYADVINSLRDDYYIITKPHHCTFYREENKDDLNTLYRISDKVVHALSPISDIAIVSDIAICDARSAVMNEVCFLNPEIKNIALMTNPKLDRFYRDISEFVDCVYDENSLRKHVDEINAKDIYVEIRKNYLDYFFDRDVKAGLNTAIETIITELEY